MTLLRQILTVSLHSVLYSGYRINSHSHNVCFIVFVVFYSYNNSTFTSCWLEWLAGESVVFFINHQAGRMMKSTHVTVPHCSTQMSDNTITSHLYNQRSSWQPEVTLTGRTQYPFDWHLVIVYNWYCCSEGFYIFLNFNLSFWILVLVLLVEDTVESNFPFR